MRSAWWLSCVWILTGCASAATDANDAVSPLATTTPIVTLETTTGPRDERSSLIASSEGVHRAAIAAFEESGRERVVVVFRDPHASEAGSSMAYAHSDDGGAHWSTGQVPVALNAQPQGLGPMIAEPTIAVSPVSNDRGDREVYFAAVASVASLPSALHRQIVISRSVDGGRTFLPASIAAAPRVTDRFQTADHPSLTVDAGGRVHLVFLADAGLPSQGLRHWVGYPDSTRCSFSCMWWQPQAESIDTGSEPHPVAGVLVRSMRNALYIVYEQVESIPDDPRTELARIVTLRFDPFLRTWVHTTEQPSRGRWFRAPALADGPNGLVPAGRHVDFGFVRETAWLTWSEINYDDSSSLVAQSFRFVNVLEEDWSTPESVKDVPAGTRTMQPTLAIRGDGLPSVSWFEQDATGHTTLFGSVRLETESWSPSRDLGSIGIDAVARPRACATETPWLDQIAAIGLGGMTPMTLTIHADRRCGDDAVGAGSLAATRWSVR
jgi:hypothetical protein